MLLWTGLGVGDRAGRRLPPERVVGGVSPARVRGHGAPAPAGRARPAHPVGIGPRGRRGAPGRAAAGRHHHRGDRRGRGVVELRGWVPTRAARAPSPAGPRSPRPASRASSTASWSAARTTSPAPGLARHRPERMTEPLAPQYNPSADRVRPLRLVEGARAVRARRHAAGARRAPTSIMMPPPNVTAVLHMGHGLNNTVQDVLIRFERMRGRRALWLPGTDHAGIATQNVVERLLAKEGLTRFDLGRDAFVERVWAYVRETGAAILEQLKAHRQLGRLVPHLLHAGRGALARRARGVRPAVRARARLPGPLHHQLVPALPHRALQRRGGEGGGRGQALAPALPARRRRRARHRGHHPARDHAGRHRRRGAPGRRALPAPGRPRAAAAGGGPPHPDRRRRGGGPGVRLRRREGHAGARPGRLRDRPPARAARRST